MPGQRIYWANEIANVEHDVTKIYTGGMYVRSDIGKTINKCADKVKVVGMVIDDSFNVELIVEDIKENK